MFSNKILKFILALSIITLNARVTEAAIAFDNSKYCSTSVSSPLTCSYTATGSNITLLVGTLDDVTGDTSTNISGITWNSVALTKLVCVSPLAGRVTCLWYLLNAGSGTHNIVVSGTASFFYAHAATYTGADTSALDSSNSSSNTTAFSITTSTTVVAANSWLAGFGYTAAGSPIAAGTGATQRTTDTDYSTGAMFDSNGTVAAGSRSMQFTCAGGNNAFIVVSLDPSGGGGGATLVSGLSLFGAGK